MHKLSNLDVAAVLYKEYVSNCEAREPVDKGELCRAYKFLAIHCSRVHELSEAYHYAQKCLGYEEVIYARETNDYIWIMSHYTIFVVDERRSKVFTTRHSCAAEKPAGGKGYSNGRRNVYLRKNTVFRFRFIMG